MSVSRIRLTPGRRDRVLLVTVLALALAVTGLVLTIWRPTAPPPVAVETDLARFDPAVVDAVTAYRGPRYLAAALTTLLAVAVPTAFVVLPAGRRLTERLAGLRERSAARAAVVALVVAVATSLATLPLLAWRAIVHDGTWGFRTQSAVSWFGDWLLANLGRWTALTLGVLLLLWAMRRWPRSWPSRLTLLGTLLAAGFVLLHPLLIQPLFLPTGPFPEGAHRDAIDEVLERADLADLPLLLGDASLRTTRVNALVTGLGPTARVVVYDTMLELPPEQVAAVMAHEVAHHEHADLPRGVLLTATALLPSLWLLRAILEAPATSRRLRLRGPTDPRLVALVLMLVAVAELTVSPVANHVSRRLEAAADARAFELSQAPGVFVRTARVFTVRDLSPPRPPAWVRLLYGTHPTVEERIAAAVAYGRAHDLPLPDLETLRAEERGLRHPAIEARSDAAEPADAEAADAEPADAAGRDEDTMP